MKTVWKCLRILLASLLILVMIIVALELALLMWIVISGIAGTLVFLIFYIHLYMLGLHLVPVEAWYGDYSMAFWLSFIPAMFAQCFAMFFVARGVVKG